MHVEVPWLYLLVVLAVKVFRKIIGQIFLAWMPLDIKQTTVNLVCDIEKFISIKRACCFFAMPAEVLLLQCMGVGGWLWPNTCSMSRMILPSLQFKNRAANSASAAEATTNLRMPQYA